MLKAHAHSGIKGFISDTDFKLLRQNWMPRILESTLNVAYEKYRGTVNFGCIIDL